MNKLIRTVLVILIIVAFWAGYFFLCRNVNNDAATPTDLATPTDIATETGL